MRWGGWVLDGVFVALVGRCDVWCRSRLKGV